MKWHGVVMLLRLDYETLLISNRDGITFYRGGMDIATRRRFGKRNKFYAKATVRGSIIEIGSTVPDKGWR